MFYTISTPPGTSFQALASTSRLAPPFDNNNGLQSNAFITSYSGRLRPLSSRGETQIGLGILFGGSNFSPHVDSSVDPILEDQPPFLDSPRPPDLNALSPAGTPCLQYPPAPEDDDADLHASTSAFSIGDWIVHPSSSPDTSDALCGSSTAPHQCEFTPKALSPPSDLLVHVNSLGAISIPGKSVGINPAVPAAPQSRSPLANTNAPHVSMEMVFLQVVQGISFSGVPETVCLSPSQTLISRSYASSHLSKLPNPQPPHVKFAGSDIGQSSGRSLTPPIEASRELASNSVFAVGRALTSPRNILSSNGSSLGSLVSPDTPVFNMHEGVSEYDLQRRANRYRRRYPGRTLDRHWLLKYAGKLNKYGRVIEDYRCYILGCAQVNKRRDHIIVHICSHVNERPFACRHWLLRFHPLAQK